MPPRLDLPASRPGLSSDDRAFASAEETFRQHFKAALFYFLRKGVSVEKSFGFVWEQTLEEIRLDDGNQRKLYHELILWAKNGAR